MKIQNKPHLTQKSNISQASRQPFPKNSLIQKVLNVNPVEIIKNNIALSCAAVAGTIAAAYVFQSGNTEVFHPNSQSFPNISENTKATNSITNALAIGLFFTIIGGLTLSQKSQDVAPKTSTKQPNRDEFGFHNNEITPTLPINLASSALRPTATSNYRDLAPSSPPSSSSRNNVSTRQKGRQENSDNTLVYGSLQNVTPTGVDGEINRITAVLPTLQLDYLPIPPSQPAPNDSTSLVPHTHNSNRHPRYLEFDSSEISHALTFHNDQSISPTSSNFDTTFPPSLEIPNALFFNNSLKRTYGTKLLTLPKNLMSSVDAFLSIHDAFSLYNAIRESEALSLLSNYSNCLSLRIQNTNSKELQKFSYENEDQLYNERDDFEKIVQIFQLANHKPKDANAALHPQKQVSESCVVYDESREGWLVWTSNIKVCDLIKELDHSVQHLDLRGFIQGKDDLKILASKFVNLKSLLVKNRRYYHDLMNLGQLRNLEYLKIEDETCYIPEYISSLRNLTKLTHLDISDSPLFTDRYTLISIGKLVSLKSLNLSNMRTKLERYADYGIDKLIEVEVAPRTYNIEVLRELVNLKELDLSDNYNRIADQNLLEDPKFLPNLESLNLAYNAVSLNTLSSIIHRQNLKKLNISNISNISNPSDINADIEFDRIFPSSSALINLETLNISKITFANNFDWSDKNIAQIKKCCPNLKEIILSSVTDEIIQKFDNLGINVKIAV